MREGEKKRIKFKVGGMSCIMCAKTIENALKKLDGIFDVTVNFGDEKASLTYNPEVITLKEIKKSVENTGYQYLGLDEEAEGIEEDALKKELERNKKRFILGFLIAGLVLFLMYSPFKFPVPSMYLMFLISTPAFLYIGFPIFKKAYRALKNKNLNMDVMYSMGTGVAFLASLLATFGILSKDFLFYETAVLLVSFLTLGRYLETKAKGKSTEAIKKLIGLQPDKALVLQPKDIQVELLYSKDCPHYKKAHEELKKAIRYLNLKLSIKVTSVEEKNYSNYDFFGSPTILINKNDLEGKKEKFFGCRTYRYKDKIYEYPPTELIINRLLHNFEEKEVPKDKLKVGEIVLVKPGERVPVDGEVVDGESYVDESMITGEPLAVFKSKGDEVIGGTINKNSVLKLIAKRVGKDTVLSEIIRLVQEAQSSKPAIQRIADKVVTYLIPIVLGIAITSFILWYFFFHSSLLFALTSLISVLVVACPCALGLATPTAVTVGIGRGAELGILIKNSQVLEISEKITTVIFDKTGTITKGEPRVTDLIEIEADRKEILKLAAGAEKNSEHPLAEAIVKKAAQEGIKIKSGDKFQNIEGKGVIAEVEGDEVMVGNKTLLKEKNILYPKDIEHLLSKLEEEGKTVIIIAVNKKVKGVIGIADTVKNDAEVAINSLKEMGLRVVMITGDNEKTARAVAKRVGIEEVIAEVFPPEKADKVKKLQRKKEVVAFVGDGINDAPALAVADVGIAVGGGTDIAAESGDVVLVKNNLLDVVSAIQLSRKVMSRIKQNLFWAFAYNAVLIPVAAGAFYPFLNITFRPEFAGFAMAMSSVTVVTLSLMLKRYVPP